MYPYIHAIDYCLSRMLKCMPVRHVAYGTAVASSVSPPLLLLGSLLLCLLPHINLANTKAMHMQATTN